MGMKGYIEITQTSLLTQFYYDDSKLSRSKGFIVEVWVDETCEYTCLFSQSYPSIFPNTYYYKEL